MKCHECGKDVGDEYYRFDEMGGEVVLCPSCTWAKPCLTKWVERHKVRKIDLQALRGGEPGSIIELPTPLTDRIDALERQIENLRQSLNCLRIHTKHRIATLERHNGAPCHPRLYTHRAEDYQI